MTLHPVPCHSVDGTRPVSRHNGFFVCLPTGRLMTYPHTQLFINGHWQDGSEGKTLPVVNPATGQEIGTVAHASRIDLDAALEAAQKGFKTWRNMSAQERGKIMRKASHPSGGAGSSNPRRQRG